MLLRDVRADDMPAWLRLWGGYNCFYEAKVDPDVTAYTFQRIVDPARPLLGRVAERDGQLAGMSISVIHEGTWSKAPTLYLEDLFVDPQARGSGIGRALLADAIEQARLRGCSRIYWHTRADNAAARRLYDAFAPADNFVRYRLALNCSAV